MSQGCSDEPRGQQLILERGYLYRPDKVHLMVSLRPFVGRSHMCCPIRSRLTCSEPSLIAAMAHVESNRCRLPRLPPEIAWRSWMHSAVRNDDGRFSGKIRSKLSTNFANSLSSFQAGRVLTSKRLACWGSVCRTRTASVVPTATIGIMSSLHSSLMAFMSSRCLIAEPASSE